mgnify:CR=1 FL=1
MFLSSRTQKVPRYSVCRFRLALNTFRQRTQSSDHRHRLVYSGRGKTETTQLRLNEQEAPGRLSPTASVQSNLQQRQRCLSLQLVIPIAPPLNSLLLHSVPSHVQ